MVMIGSWSSNQSTLLLNDSASGDCWRVAQLCWDISGHVELSEVLTVSGMRTKGHAYSTYLSMKGTGGEIHWPTPRPLFQTRSWQGLGRRPLREPSSELDFGPCLERTNKGESSIQVMNERATLHKVRGLPYISCNVFLTYFPTHLTATTNLDCNY